MVVLLVDTIRALGLAGLVGWAAWRARWLTGTGAFAACACGALSILAGWDWAAILITYFISASVVSKIGEISSPSKTAMLESVVAKGGARDVWQVLANGGVFSAMALSWIIHPHPIVALIALSALATSAADTFATEIGTLSQRAPRSIITGKVVLAGTSGGVTIVGIAGALGGAAIVCGTSLLFRWSYTIGLCAFAGAILGMLADSVLGATLQARLRCPRCRQFTEQTVHTICGTQTELAGGLSWITNDSVNFLATLIGSAIAALCYWLITLNFGL